MKYLDDHGLPLVQLKEQRRELVVALAGRKAPISNSEIAEIASLQQAIAAMEAVVGDLDSQVEFYRPRTQTTWAFGIAQGGVARNMELIFGRRHLSDRNSRLRSSRAGW
jgi:hypothetical protein